MKAQDKLDIYELLMTNYEEGDCIPMSALGSFLRAHEVTPERYGFSRLLDLFQAIPEVFRLSSKQPHPGVPLLWDATILPRPEIEEAADTSGLPATMDETTLFFHYDRQNYLAQMINGHPSRLTWDQLRQIEKDYGTEKAAGRIYFDEEHECYSYRLSLKAANGSALKLSFQANKRPDGHPWVVIFGGYDNANSRGSRPSEALRAFAFLGNQTEFLRDLAEHAQEEVWNFSGKEDDYYILNQYITYTFYRLQLQDKVCIADDGSFAAFNTGLQTRRLGEDLFAYFVPNAEDATSPWIFQCFCSSESSDANERRCYKNMFGAFKEPEPATYFTKISDLLFDPMCEVRLSSDHIFNDNCDRLPMEFLERECAWNPEANALLEEIKNASGFDRKALFEKLGEVITEDSDLFSSMNERLEGALARTIKRVRRNYKLAVPCFFPTRNVMSMMLPLSFTSTGKPSLVLVCERTRSGDYLGQTVLTLPMAYIDARLLCRPGSEWLNTQNIVSPEQLSPDGFTAE